MIHRLWVSNSSPLIIFQRIGRFNMLEQIHDQWFIPSAVRQEVFGSNVVPAWITEQPLSQPLAAHILAARLGAGESAAIALAVEMQATRILLDDLPARRLVQALNIPAMGSLGILLLAKEQGLIPAIRPLIEAMQQADFRVSESVLLKILVAAGEAV